MYLYEMDKDKNKINVFELKEIKDKLFEFKRKEMEKLDRCNIVYEMLSNNFEDISMVKDIEYFNDEHFIYKKNYIFKHFTGLKLNSLNYFLGNEFIIDGLIYQLCSGNFDNYYYDVKKVYNGKKDNINNYLLVTNPNVIKSNTNFLKPESFKYKISNLISIPESIYFLRQINISEFDTIIDKNIDEQLSLYEFNEQPIKQLDLETIKFVNKNFITDDILEVNQNILKKVRMINK